MIIGSGLLARSMAPYFSEDSDTLIFAAGVSNSLETSPAEFDRERELLSTTLNEWAGPFVYFGSCSVANGDHPRSAYAQHKLRMESLVLSGDCSMVVRLPQVVGASGNPKTLTNFLHRKITSGETFDLWANAERNLIDADHVAAITNALVQEFREPSCRVFTVASARSVTMLELVRTFENVLSRSARYRLQNRGESLPLNPEFAVEVAKRLGIDLADGYVERTIRKYYGRLS